MKIIVCLLIVFDIVGVIYVRNLIEKMTKKIDEIDDAVFEYMKEEHNSRCKCKQSE